MAPDGVWIFEVGYLLNVFTRSLFDTIYHEHVDFHSVEPIRKFCAANGLKLLNASSNPIQGGSLRCYVGWPETSPLIEAGSRNVADLIREEVAVGLHIEATFLRWVSLPSFQPKSFFGDISIIAIFDINRVPLDSCNRPTQFKAPGTKFTHF